VTLSDAKRFGFNNKSVAALPALAERYEALDEDRPHFRVRVSPDGKKRFYVKARLRGRGREVRYKVGDFDGSNVPAMGDAAAAALKLIAAGAHPLDRWRVAREHTVASVIADYAAFSYGSVPPPKHFKQAESTLLQEIASVWGKRLLSEVTQADARALLERLKAGQVRRTKKGRERRTTIWTAHRVLVNARAMFAWVVERRDIYGLAVSPFQGMSDARTLGLKGRAKRRSHALTDEEIARVWHAADQTCPVYAALIKCLLLTPQRVEDMCGAEWKDVHVHDGRPFLQIEPDRYKTDTPHEVALTPTVFALLTAIRKPGCRWLFSRDGHRKLRAGPYWKAKLDIASGVGAPTQRTAEHADKLNGRGWELHDLRRTGRSRMRSCGIPRDTCELSMGHLLPGMDRVYDVGNYRKPNYEGGRAPERHILAIVGEELKPAATRPTLRDKQAKPARPMSNPKASRVTQQEPRRHRQASHSLRRSA